MSSEEIWFSRSAVPERGSLVLCGSRLHQQRQGMTQPFLPALYRRPPQFPSLTHTFPQVCPAVPAATFFT